MQDSVLRQDIIDEFEFDPSFDGAHVGVAVENGIVTLTGHVESCAQKLAAVSAARRVKGVHGIADEIEVRYPDQKKTADDQIAKRALNVLNWDSTLSPYEIDVTVSAGWVNLERYCRLAIREGSGGAMYPQAGRGHRGTQRNQIETASDGRGRQVEDRGGAQASCRERSKGHTSFSYRR